MLKEGVVLQDRYEIISRIGSGGMADVYKAMDHKLNRMVAVKVLKSEFRADSMFVNKFRTEAQAAAGLAHPNIVNVYDVGDDRGVYYIVMELVEGITLKDYITRKKKLGIREATSIAIQVSLGLEAAHKRNIIHRDVKPQNIIISTDGKVKLSDFGIAKATSSNTISSNAMGSVHYSSPEQVRGGFSDFKSDIYSLGITMYEMVTGRVPFDGDTTVAIAIKHLQEEIVAPSKYTPELPFAFEQIILKCTQKSPDRRYKSMSELIDDLKHSITDPQGDFVALIPLASHAQTVKLTDAELAIIRSAGSGKTVQNPDLGIDRARKIDDTEEDLDEEDVRPAKPVKTSKPSRPSKASYKDVDEYDDDSFDETDDPYYEQDDKKGLALEKVINIGGLVIGAVIIMILIYLIAQAAGLFGHSDKNNDQDNAQTISSSLVDASQPADENQIPVPDLSGKTEAEAIELANSMSLGVVSGGNELSETVPVGQICRQTPDAGTYVDPNTTITYYVSSGSATITVPTGLVGASQSEAEEAISAMGLIPQVSGQYSDSVPEGIVISVDPVEGSVVAPGASVSVVVSLGQDLSEDIVLLDIRGYSLDFARELLADGHYDIQVTYDHSDRISLGEVITMMPEPGTIVKTGSTVTLVVNSDSVVADTPAAETPAPETPAPVDEVSWTCTQSLSAPEKYSSSNNAKIELLQVQNGTEVVVYSEEGNAITSWPHAIRASWNASASSQSAGRIVFYMQDADGNYTAIAQYANVPLSQG